MKLTINDYLNRFKNWSKKDMAEFCRGKINLQKHLAKHTINKYLIFQSVTWDVVNTEKLTVHCFKSETEAVDCCLDKYKDSKSPEQLSF